MHKLRVAQFVLFACSLCAGTPRIDAVQVSEAIVSYMPWDLLTRSDLTPDRVRANPDFRLSIHDSSRIQNLINHLPVDALKHNPAGPGDIRLVIDFKLKSGKRISFCASNFYFYSEDQKQRTTPGAQFFQEFKLEQLPFLH